MIDIRYRKVGGAPQAEPNGLITEADGSAAERPRARSRASVLIDLLNGAAGSAFVHSASTTVAGAQRTAERRKVPRREPNAAIKTASRRLRTPVGKALVVQAAAIVAVGAMALSRHPAATVREDAAASGTQRKYLPVIAPAAPISPFQAGAAGSLNAAIRLHGVVSPSGVTQPSPAAPLFRTTIAQWMQLDPAGTAQPADWTAWRAYRSAYPSAADAFVLGVGATEQSFTAAVSGADSKQALIRRVIDAARNERFSGIELQLPLTPSLPFTVKAAFLRDFAAALRQGGLKPSVRFAAPPDPQEAAEEWSAAAQIVDGVTVAAYGYRGDEAATDGPDAPLGWVADVAATLVAASGGKGGLELGNSSYDRSAPDRDRDFWSGSRISYEQGAAIGVEKGSPAIRRSGIDDRGYDIGSPAQLEYSDASGRKHSVWLEDSQSLDEKVSAAAAAGIRDIRFAVLGTGDPAAWSAVAGRR